MCWECNFGLHPLLAIQLNLWQVSEYHQVCDQHHLVHPVLWNEMMLLKLRQKQKIRHNLCVAAISGSRSPLYGVETNCWDFVLLISYAVGSFTLLPHRQKVACSFYSPGPVSVGFVCSLCVCMGSVRSTSFLPWFQRHAREANWQLLLCEW